MGLYGNNGKENIVIGCIHILGLCRLVLDELESKLRKGGHIGDYIGDEIGLLGGILGV